MPEGAVDVGEVLQFVKWELIPFALLVLVGAFVFQQISRRLLNDLGERFTEWRLSLKKVSAIGRLVVVLLGLGIAIASVLDLRSEALFALLGTIGIAVGFAFKDLLASLMAGVLLLVDEPFQVGDRVSFKGYYGEIQSIGFRSVRLVTLDDNLVTIPNSAFLTEAVASANAGALDCMVVVPVCIAPTDDFVLARRLIAEAGATSRYVFLQKPLVTTLRDEFIGRHYVTVIDLKAYVFDARYEKAFVSDVTERVKLALRSHGFITPDINRSEILASSERALPAD
ncbi:MAG: mechanosensitive ion channel family protein [Deltaproteobacteria bacterium]|nr:MAG: mechanosensitive ion channel family protein [Deltaproteobacteria bacterium]